MTEGDAILAEARLLFGYLGGVDPVRRTRTIDALRAELDKYDVTLRRYEPLRQRPGTVIPLAVRQAVQLRDGLSCVGAKVGMPGECGGTFELDHVRASGAVGMKSPTTASNLVRICSLHHRVKTEAGKVWRPRLLDYIATLE